MITDMQDYSTDTGTGGSHKTRDKQQNGELMVR